MHAAVELLSHGGDICWALLGRAYVYQSSVISTVLCRGPHQNEQHAAVKWWPLTHLGFGWGAATLRWTQLDLVPSWTLGSDLLLVYPILLGSEVPQGTFILRFNQASSQGWNQNDMPNCKSTFSSFCSQECPLASQWIIQVAWSKPGRGESHSTLHEVLVSVWIYSCLIPKWRIQIRNSVNRIIHQNVSTQCTLQTMVFESSHYSTFSAFGIFSVFLFIYFFWLFTFSRATPAAYGGSQARDLRPTPQLTATPDP